MGARSFKDLIVWQKADALSLLIYQMTRSFPPEEQYRLVDQMLTAASSIPSNIAEGFGRWPPKERARFYEVAKGSGDELKGHLKQAAERKYCTRTAKALKLADEICAMLYVLRRKIMDEDFDSA